MDFILNNSNRLELNYMRHNMEIDIDIGETNDFKVSMSDSDYIKFDYQLGGYFFSEGTEYGGMFGIRDTSTKKGEISLSGDTFRGMLRKKIISPPSGQAYKTVTGECNSVMSSLLSGEFGTLFKFGYYDYDTQTVVTNSGFSVSNYSFDRYTDVLSGLTKMLYSVGAKLQIQCVSGGTNEPFSVYLSATEIKDLADEVEYSQDNKLDFITKQVDNGINHLILLGSGELQNRTVVHLYADANNNISQTQTFTGINERVSVFDYPNAEDTTSLISEGTEKFKELLNYKDIQIEVDNLDIDYHDIVGGRDRLTGFYTKTQVINKIVKVSDGYLTIDYKVGDSL